MDAYNLTVRPDAVVGENAGQLVAEILVGLIGTHGPDACRRFAEGSLGAIVGVLPVLIGNDAAVEELERALALLRLRIAEGISGTPGMQ